MKINNIYSIGYGGRNFTDFVQIMLDHEITLIVDIRSYPFSKYQPSFRKKNLQSCLPATGIDYTFLGELGGKPKASIFYNPSGELNVELLTATKFYQEAINTLLDLSHNYQNICIMCSELHPTQCHRKTIVAETLIKIGVDVKHILKEGGIQKHSDDRVSAILF